ncbi:PREDICTED: MLP-like protein 423 [Tarenaya hassleriana]|uniref:MLP-like protein 423 n=1 Tax=Tarenaya hassleriana TaxID=28532 RepID=UPI00053C4F19|nr:PREDICTED: MLP-like protein 423 [Tarenaya hassleriana]
MASRGSIVVEVDAKSSGEEMWKILGDPITNFPKILPDSYKSIQVIQGSSFAPGTVALVTYGEGFPTKTATEKIVSVSEDEPNKGYSYTVIGGMEELYKAFDGTFTVIPKVQGCTVKFSCQYIKTNKDIPNPTLIVDFKIKNFVDIDAYLQNN